MKKTLIALAVLAASGAVMAQSSVTISGAFRVGYKHDAKNATATNQITDDQASGNNVNFNVVEDLGGGLKAMGRVQLRYRIANGENSNSSDGEDLFHLASFGLQGGFGTIEAGRIGFDQVWGYNPFGSNGAHVNVSGLAGATEDNQWRYTAPTFVEGLKIQVGGAFKDGIAAGTGVAPTKNSSQFLVTYATGPFAATAVVEQAQASATASTALPNKVTALGASYNLGVAKVMAIYAKETTAADVQVNKGYSLSVTAPVGPVLLKAGYKNAEKAVGVKNNKTAVGVEYALSKRTAAEFNVYKSTADVGTSYFAGVKHSF